MADDLVNAWTYMPKSQALRWYFRLLTHAPVIIRDRNFYSADDHMNGELTFFLSGERFVFDAAVIPGNPFGFFREMFLRRIYFRGFDLARIPFQFCVDLGANEGIVSCVLKRLGGPSSVVVGVDAMDFSTSRFRREPSLISGIDFCQYLVCGSETRNDPSKLRRLAEETASDPARAIAINELLQKFLLPRVDFLKIDIEGSEFSIFCEDATWLRTVENIAMEVHASKGHPEAIVNVLRENGFMVLCSDHLGRSRPPEHCELIHASRTGALTPGVDSSAAAVTSSRRSSSTT